MVARALVTHPGSREAFLATLMLCSEGSRDGHVSVGTLTLKGRCRIIVATCCCLSTVNLTRLMPRVLV